MGIFYSLFQFIFFLFVLLLLLLVVFVAPPLPLQFSSLCPQSVLLIILCLQLQVFNFIIFNQTNYVLLNINNN